MKFKKVQIQAFRAYDKVENGTFDFVHTRSGLPSDFVSIYAPNGFGKTSFYDAVEWGFTNNINRFLRRPAKNADAAKAERTYKADTGTKGKQHIIRNRHSSPELPGFVRLSTTLSDKDIINEIPEVRNGEPDFKFKISDTKKGTEYFQDVVLSQEWIDAFLKEDDASIRYDKFIAYFGDKNIDHYYKTICSLIKTNETTILGLKKDLKACQTQLNFNGDRDILGKVNSHIAGLRQLGFSFPDIDEQFKDVDFLKLANNIAVERSKLENIGKDLKERGEAVGRLIIGTADEPGTAEYLQAKENELVNRKNIQELAARMEACQQKITAFTQSRELGQRISRLNEDLKLLLNIKAQYDYYELLVKERSKESDELSSARQQLSSYTDRLAQEKLRQTQADQQLEQLLAQIEINKARIVDSEKEYKIFDNLTRVRSEAQHTFDVLKEKTGVQQTRKNELDKEINALNASVVFINNQNFKMLSAAQQLEFKEQIDSISLLTIARKEIEEQLRLIGQDILAQEQLNSEIERFVLAGVDLITRTQQTQCPLCNTDFQTFSKLADTIARNKYLNDRLQASLQLQQQKQDSLVITDNEIISQLDAMTALIYKNIQQLKIEATELKNTINQLEKEKDELDKQIRELSQQLVDWSARFDGVRPAEYNEGITNTIRRVEEELKMLHDHKKELSAGIVETEKTISDLRSEFDRHLQRLEQIAKDSQYGEVTNYFSKILKVNAVNKNLLNSMEADIKANISQMEGDKTQVESVISPGENEDSVRTELTGLITTSDDVGKISMDLQKVIASFERTLGKLGLNFEEERLVNELVDALNLESDRIDTEINSVKIRLSDLALLEQLQANAVPYLTYQRTQKTADNYTARIKLLKDKVNKALLAEKTKVSSHIHNQVKSFFYEQLINDLYQKIDPHPDYKKIKFQCDFTYDKPRLNVFVLGENDNNPLVPNLYFSTAQMNILSLSIFLAKALNARDDKDNPVNCIFIDDPIQSMDSINILSTIDLLRGIMVKFKKQIILSTHDENFHNLLKKKIPSDKADATYIELETFGTVKK